MVREQVIQLKLAVRYFLVGFIQNQMKSKSVVLITHNLFLTISKEGEVIQVSLRSTGVLRRIHEIE